jgi:hypothetical protein
VRNNKLILGLIIFMSSILLIPLMSNQNAYAGFSGPVHSFEFNGNFEDSLSNKIIENPFGGTVTSTTYVFDEGQGLKLNNPSVSNDVHSVEMCLKVDDNSDWRKLVDYHNRIDDEGLYVNPDDRIDFYDADLESAKVILDDTFFHVVVTSGGGQQGVRDITVFVDGVEEYSFADIYRDAKISESDILWFVIDDTDTTDEDTIGTLNYLNIYNYALGQNQVTELAGACSVEPTPEPEPEPEPSTCEMYAGMSKNHNENPQDGSFATVNLDTGNLHEVGPAAAELEDRFKRDFGLSGIAINNAREVFGTMVGGEGSVSALVEIDPSTGKIIGVNNIEDENDLTFIELGDMSVKVVDLAFHPQTDDLYGIVRGDDYIPYDALVTINTTTGKATFVGFLVLLDEEVFMFAGGLSFLSDGTMVVTGEYYDDYFEEYVNVVSVYSSIEPDGDLIFPDDWTELNYYYDGLGVSCDDKIYGTTGGFQDDSIHLITLFEGEGLHANEELVAGEGTNPGDVDFLPFSEPEPEPEPPICEEPEQISTFFDFNDGVPDEFSGVITTESVQGLTADGFDGNFVRNITNPPQNTTLTLTDLPPHDTINIGFLLAILDSWDSTNGSVSPDLFNVSVDGNTIFTETFALASGSISYDAPEGVLIQFGEHRGFWASYPEAAYNMTNEL